MGSNLMKFLNVFPYYYTKASEVFELYYQTMYPTSPDEKEDAVEIYLITLNNLTGDNLKAIAQLIENNLYTQAIMICRNIFESIHNLQWILKGNDGKEKSRVYRLEGSDYLFIEKSIASMKNNPIFHNTFFIEGLHNKLKKYKEEYSYLWESDELKGAPKFFKRIDEDKYFKEYPYYNFMSIFTHPSPNLKHVFIPHSIDRNPYINYDSQLIHLLFYCLKNSIIILDGILTYKKEIMKDAYIKGYKSINVSMERELLRKRYMRLLKGAYIDELKAILVLIDEEINNEESIRILNAWVEDCYPHCNKIYVRKKEDKYEFCNKNYEELIDGSLLANVHWENYMIYNFMDYVTDLTI